MREEKNGEKERKTMSIGGVTGLIAAVLLRWVSGMGMEREWERNRKEERRKNRERMDSGGGREVGEKNVIS